MSENFKVFVGDDTGLLKNVKMTYRYQVDIVGSNISKQMENDDLDENVFDNKGSDSEESVSNKK